jgi:hypothetical protein
MLGLKHGCGIMADPTTRFGKVLHLRGDKGALGGDVEWHNIIPLFRRVDGQGSVSVVMMNGTTSHTFSAGRTASPFRPHALLHGAPVQLGCCGVQLRCCGPLS